MTFFRGVGRIQGWDHAPCVLTYMRIIGPLNRIPLSYHMIFFALHCNYLMHRQVPVVIATGTRGICMSKSETCCWNEGDPWGWWTHVLDRWCVTILRGSLKFHDYQHCNGDPSRWESSLQYVAASNLIWLRSMTGRAQFLGARNHCRQHLESAAFHQDEYITTSRLVRHEGLLGFRGSCFEEGNAGDLTPRFAFIPRNCPFWHPPLKHFTSYLVGWGMQYSFHPAGCFCHDLRFHYFVRLLGLTHCWFIPFSMDWGNSWVATRWLVVRC